MAPSAFVVLEALPLTSNGKVDHRALAEPDGLHPELEGASKAPRDEFEERLVGIWADLLGVARVGVNEDFFELGGHSLLATRVISRIREIFGFDLPLRRLFEAPTVAELAVVITQHQAEEFDPEEMACILAELESPSQSERSAGERS